ncbi:tellurite resistance TerB family protein [Lutibacter citreus]|uniref:TerB family tellurite resistance protein n=1 Tax=Lutibacter citreus TaxID=2138210 RepID=UPI000DBE1E24|nr:TerB family tellurite resistance protein [Lutibacter citreus]
MGVSDFNLEGEQKKNIAHFASIVNLALADEIISEGEDKLLRRVAKRFHILEDKYKEILENSNNYPIKGLHSYDERIEHLYDLAKMIYADDEVSSKEVGILRKICTGLGFPIDNVEKVADEAIHLVLNDNDLEDFTKAIKQVNRF